MALESKFNFTPYPHLKKAFQKFCVLDDKASRASEKKPATFSKAMNAFEEYAYGEFASMVYELFTPLKPVLRNIRKGGTFQWDEIFDVDKPFAELSLSQKKYLVGLIEGYFVYLLPEEYYTE